jgi:hypothetical protein
MQVLRCKWSEIELIALGDVEAQVGAIELEGAAKPALAVSTHLLAELFPPHSLWAPSVVSSAFVRHR